jgi:transcriptional/translational regulatory protein YebC/TACO1
MKLKSQDLSKILNKYSDKWVALKPETADVIAVGENLKLVIEKARKTGVDTPVVTRVPKDYGTYVL